MPNLQADDIADIAKTTLNELGRFRFTDIASTITEYEVLPKMLKRDRTAVESGKGISRNLMTDLSRAATHVGLFATDEVNVGDVMQTIDVPWRHTTTNYAFDRREPAMNTGVSQIVSIIKVRRTDAMISLAEKLEDTFWGKPASSADDVTPFGLDYWIVYNASEGFTGQNPDGFSAGAGGLDSATYTRWRNWSAQYTDITKPDLVTKMRKLHRRTNFKSPVDIADYRTTRGQTFRIYANEETVAGFETIGEAQNENLGRDLAPFSAGRDFREMDSAITFRKNPIVYIPKLDEDSNDPIFFVNWGVFKLVFLKGELLREEKPKVVGNAHTVVQVHVDTTWNTICPDRRRNGIISKGARP